MNTYRIRQTLDDGYDFVNADYYYISSQNILSFYRRFDDMEELKVATFDPWISVVMMDEVENYDSQDE